jgi:chorismate mutase
MPMSAPPSPTSLAPSMRRCRQRMDALDRVLVGLLCRRSSLSVRIARLKRGAGLPLHAPHREGEILSKVKSAARDPLTPVALERIFRVILTEMRGAQRRKTAPAKRARKSPARDRPRDR